MDNRSIANRLIDYAHHLEAREASLYRIRAYRRAAETILRLDRPAVEIVAENGQRGLRALPGIGAHLSYTIDTLARTGQFRTLDGEGTHIDSLDSLSAPRHEPPGSDWCLD
jgi:DNA polymerase/3'-5' exonuclease PolX